MLQVPGQFSETVSVVRRRDREASDSVEHDPSAGSEWNEWLEYRTRTLCDINRRQLSEMQRLRIRKHFGVTLRDGVVRLGREAIELVRTESTVTACAMCQVLVLCSSRLSAIG